MRLIRVGLPGAEQPAVLIDRDHYVDLTPLTSDLFGTWLSPQGLERIRVYVEDSLARGMVEPLDGVRMGPPIPRPHQIVCIGLNYADHAAESGLEVPSEPLVFTKSPNTMVGPNDDVIIPRGSAKTDWEVELGVVIGSRASYLADEQEALEHIAGYVLVNDVSEREFQLERGGQWSKGKSCATFNPCGPWLLTSNELDGEQSLEMWLDVNGQRMQTGSTATMVFQPAHIVHYLSQFMVLEPGDLINTGTPPGVGLGMSPPRYLRHGDVVELGIDQLGTQRQRFVVWHE